MKIWIIEIGQVQRGGNIHWEFEGAMTSRVKAKNALRLLRPRHERAQATCYDVETQEFVGYSIDIRNVSCDDNEGKKP